jgi:hypothetical protein
MMQDRNGPDSGYLVPETWDPISDTRYLISAEGRTLNHRRPSLGTG